MNLRFLLIDFIFSDQTEAQRAEKFILETPPALSKSQYWLQDVNVR